MLFICLFIYYLFIYLCMYVFSIYVFMYLFIHLVSYLSYYYYIIVVLLLCVCICVCVFPCLDMFPWHSDPNISKKTLPSCCSEPDAFEVGT
jgi:hypothetical protein